MVSVAPAPLTRIGFRRDVRLFLGALFGFLVVIILLLLVFLQSFNREAEQTITRQWEKIADVVASEVASSATSGALLSKMAELQARFALAGLQLSRGSSQAAVGVQPGPSDTREVIRRTPVGTLHVVFDASRLSDLQRKFRLTALVCSVAAAIGLVLFLLYLPKVTRPIEALLEEAQRFEERSPGADEQQYLIDTFRRSVETLKAHEAELQSLHAFQKSRADELALVTATLTRNLTSGFISIDPSGQLVDINAAGREILGISSEDLHDRPIRELLGGPAGDILARALDSRLALTRQEIVRPAGERQQIIGFTTVPLVDDSERFLGMLALLTDLTDVRELENRLRDLRALADLGEISTGIAHEFRNSLSTILGQLRLARRGSMSAEALHNVERAEEEASALADAVTGLLVFAKPLAITTQRVDLLELLESVCARLEKPPGAIVECSGEPAMVDGDAAMLRRAFENLVRNALESVAQKGAGQVTVSVAATPRPSVRITDDGVGIDEGDVPRLLLPFQSDNPTGYGIGLPLARKIILLHGGILRLTGERGRGAEAVAEFAPEGSAADSPTA